MNEIRIHQEQMPSCDMPGCDEEAPYDVKTIMGPHGNLCEKHFRTHGTSIGGKRVLIEKKDIPKTDKMPVVSFKLTRAIVFDEEYPSVKCPHCKEPRNCEMDANYTVTCEACGNKYRIRSPM